LLIVGCGHQTLPRIIERAEVLFDALLYGVIGGLHYPVPDGCLTVAGLNMQRLVSSGTGPISPLTEDDVRNEFATLANRSPGIVALSGHEYGFCIHRREAAIQITGRIGKTNSAQAASYQGLFIAFAALKSIARDQAAASCRPGGAVRTGYSCRIGRRAATVRVGW